MATMHLSIAWRLSMVFLLSALLTLLSGALSGVPSAGATTASAVSGYQVVNSTSTFSNSLSPKTARAICPLGKRVIGGGGSIYQPGVGYIQRTAFTELRPVFRYDGTRDAYVVTAAETPPGTTENWLVEAYAVCADPLPGMFMVAYTTSRPRLPCRLRLPGVHGLSARAGGSAPCRAASFSRRHEPRPPATSPA